MRMHKTKKDPLKPHMHLDSLHDEAKHRKNNPFREVFLPFFLSAVMVLVLYAAFSAIPAIKSLFRNTAVKKNMKQNVQVFKPSLPFSKDQMGAYARYESFAYFDPVKLVELMRSKKNTFVLVDLRSAAAYGRGHIKSAVHIPVSKSISSLTVLEKERLLESYRNLGEKEIILYADTRYSSSVRDTAAFLYEGGMYPRMLSVGWNDFRFLINTWLPEDMWDGFDISQFIDTPEG